MAYAAQAASGIEISLASVRRGNSARGVSEYEGGERAVINQKRVPSGLEGLDKVLDNIRYGDNIVWQISSMKEYSFFARPFVEISMRNRKNTVYFYFGQGEPMFEAAGGPKIISIDPLEGFEATVMQVHDVIEREGDETHYVFDSLTVLQKEWIADFMMSNFFDVIAPDILKHKCVAYHSITRNLHSVEALARIRDGAQVLLDVFHENEQMFLHPLRVTERYRYSMFLPHHVNLYDPNIIEPLTNGIAVSKFYSIVGESGNVDSEQRLDSWERFFLNKQRELREVENDPEDADSVLTSGIRELCRLVFGTDERMLDIAARNVNLKDILAIKARMIGVGSVGGKATGMILSRMIVDKKLPEIAKVLEPHDSFYICSNLYYTFLVKNKCWGLKLKQRTKRGYFTVAEILKEKIMEGEFTENIREQFRRMLEYYGQSPIIVRSSSLLEDSFGNAFAGKYESVFCVNLGTLEERLVAFEDAVRTVYASTMDESVLEYRLRRNLSTRDEQMALLIQRVSGSLFKDVYMPAAAGVAYSYNSYRWDKAIDPKQGMIRIVMGLGTRAVDRTDGDYPRIAALDNPDMRPTSGTDISKYAQHKVDVLELATNSITTINIEQAQEKMSDWFRATMIEHDHGRERELREIGLNRKIIFTTCDSLLRREDFVSSMRKILAAVEQEYDYPVDVEFALNFSKTGEFVINLLQCRPLQVGGSGIRAEAPVISREKTYFLLDGGTMGGAYYQPIDIVVCVDPKNYYEYPYHKKSGIARIIGAINQYYKNKEKVIMLLVPGRLGTTSPELGVPVKFAEISSMSIAGEVAYEGAGYMPELSFGSHFFQDLVETDVLYVSIFENKNTTKYYDPGFLDNEKNILSEIYNDPEVEELSDIVKVYDTSGRGLKIVTDITTGVTLCGEF
ncbi:MAG: PEP/pyruvate-binding domain-containing protein [Clostridiales Family XIII bacterium]|jgi:hypothetical protein|nr:PEP/pyruvate-binding domain-containing protein [Clostridiales Family XIII bacterium]